MEIWPVGVRYSFLTAERLIRLVETHILGQIIESHRRDRNTSASMKTIRAAIEGLFLLHPSYHLVAPVLSHPSPLSWSLTL